MWDVIALIMSTTPARVTCRRERVMTPTAPMLTASPSLLTLRGGPTGLGVPSFSFLRCTRLRRRSYSLFCAGVRFVFGAAVARAAVLTYLRLGGAGLAAPRLAGARFVAGPLTIQTGAIESCTDRLVSRRKPRGHETAEAVAESVATVFTR